MSWESISAASRATAAITEQMTTKQAQAFVSFARIAGVLASGYFCSLAAGNSKKNPDLDVSQMLGPAKPVSVQLFRTCQAR
ncbi:MULTISPECIES: hypothetical protein [unclassified Mesorhizobium]|uniref:hypothetical protein n=1 Tax=unclassified Mesorhizobium TaxID=325217 RepID=UPI00117DFB61|nr:MULTISPECIES: hypothetical protein [unclassified Mesorhizobium]TRD04675.1 hypothetical protein FJV82_12460 [Mesorhizobium sp. WSM4305]